MAGEILKKRREDLGRDIREIADLLKINAAYLVAIENDALKELPAPVYTMGYIRCYAKYLNVDAESIIEYYTKNLSQPAHSTIIPIAFSQKKVPRLYYVILLGVCSLAVFFFVSHDRTKPKETATVFPTKETTRVSPTKETARVSPTKETARVSPGSVGAVATTPPGSSTPSVASTYHYVGEHRLEIAATATTWISVKFADGRSEEILLRPGGSKDMRFSDKALLKIGNAGGITVRLDEKDLGAPGKPGQVITLSLPPDEAPSPVTSP